MFTSFLVLFVSCVALSVAQTDTEDSPYYQRSEVKPQECGPNEVFNRCIGCPPEDTCYDRVYCLQVITPCHPGCVCKEGFIRKTLGRECIPKEECSGPCEIFTQYTECKQIANETCPSIVSPSILSNDSEGACTPGCACLNGYYRADENSPCLHRCLCPEMKDSPDCAYLRT